MIPMMFKVFIKRSHEQCSLHSYISLWMHSFLLRHLKAYLQNFSSSWICSCYRNRAYRLQVRKVNPSLLVVLFGKIWEMLSWWKQYITWSGLEVLHPSTISQVPVSASFFRFGCHLWASCFSCYMWQIVGMPPSWWSHIPLNHKPN